MTTHTKQQQDKVFETDFIDSQKLDPPFAHLLALSHMFFSCMVVSLFLFLICGLGQVFIGYKLFSQGHRMLC